MTRIQKQKQNNKKYFICSLLFFFSFSNILLAHEEPSKTLYERSEKTKVINRICNSRIMTSIAIKYSAVEGKIYEHGEKITLQKYNKNGTLHSIEAYKNDSMSLKVEYTYDIFNNMLSDIDYSSENKILEKNLYKYDNEGRVVSGESYDENELSDGFFTIEKSDDKKTLFFNKYRHKDTLDYLIEYKYLDDYDESDYFEANKYDVNNKLTLRVEKKFDIKGRMIRKIISDGDLNISYMFNFEYNNQDNISKISRGLADGTIEWVDSYLYDDKGNCTEINSFNSKGILEFQMKYIYDYFLTSN